MDQIEVPKRAHFEQFLSALLTPYRQLLTESLESPDDACPAITKCFLVLILSSSCCFCWCCSILEARLQDGGQEPIRVAQSVLAMFIRVLFQYFWGHNSRCLGQPCPSRQWRYPSQLVCTYRPACNLGECTKIVHHRSTCQILPVLCYAACNGLDYGAKPLLHCNFQP